MHRENGTPLRDMLPRQRRTGGGTGSARRKSMRPWQGPGTASRGRAAAHPQRNDGFRVLWSRSVSPEWPVRRCGRPVDRPHERSKSGHSRTVDQSITPASSFSHSRRAPQPAIVRFHPPRRAAPRTAREVGLTSRTGPPPAGNGAAVSPSPLSPVQRADPRSIHGSPPGAGRARAHGRAHGHTTGARRTLPGTRPGFEHRPPARTTIPPSGRSPLNGRDAANYAGFTDVLSRAAYSSGLGQMRVQPE